MIFSRITIKNFLSIEEATLLFENGVHLITGRNHDMASDEDESNGSGKSTLFEAIHWCLYGTLSRGLERQDEVVNKVAGEDCFVRVIFSHKGKVWEVIRTRKHHDKGNSLEWFIDDQPQALHELSASKNALSDNLPISESVFRHAIQVGQGMPDRFLALSETEKQDLLCEIIDLSVYDIALERSKDNLREAETQVRVREESIASLRRQVEEWDGKVQEASGTVSSFVESGGSVADAIDTRLAAIETSLTNSEEAKAILSQRSASENNTYQEWNTRYNSEVGKFSESRKAREDESASRQAEARAADKQWQDYLQALSSASMGLTAAASAASVEAKNKQEAVQQLATGKCEYCDQDLGTLLAPRKSELETEAARLMEVWRDQDEERKKNQAFYEENKTKAREAKDQWERFLHDLREAHKAAQEAEEETIAKIKAQLDLAQETASATSQEVQKIDQQASELRTEKEGLTAQKSTYERELARLQAAEKSAMETREGLAGKIPVEEETKREYEKTRDHWKYWKDNIPNLRSAAMTQVLSFLNSKLEKYMQLFSGGSMKMELFQKEWGKGSRINVGLWTPGGTYALSSGGERRRVDLALYLALSDLLQVSSGVTPNIMVCDEIMDGLSPAGVRKFLEVLRTKAEEEGMCIYVITHNPSVCQVFQFDSIYCVTKEGGKARLT